MMAFKIHISLEVFDLKRSVEFYSILFGETPIKLKSDYAKFDLDSPALNLSLIQNNSPRSSGFGEGPSVSHFGIQVNGVHEVKDAIARFKLAGIEAGEESNTNCCYALQDKVWIKDPDGNPWEVFTVHGADPAPNQSHMSSESMNRQDALTPNQSCCTPLCCT